ncbi:MAG: hypothetical protein RBQ97_03740 [Acholeplasma sp.]|nr:hypothetical protein [Acholeplasma sp.]
MRSKLKFLELRLTELSTYLGFSRPTLYKFLNDFEKKEFKNIDFKVKVIFDFIMQKSTTSKIEVINKIIELNRQNESHNSIDTFIQKIKSDATFVKQLNTSIEHLGVELIVIEFQNSLKKLIKEKIDND